MDYPEIRLGNSQGFPWKSQIYLVSLHKSNVMDTIKELKKFEGKQVSVFTGQPNRNSYQPHISVSGILEAGNNGDYRVVMDNGNYCYFRPENVADMTYGLGHTFNDGSKVVIRLDFDYK